MESKQIEQNQQQEQKQRGRKSATLLLLLILLVTITVGFAVLSATLNIRGTSKIAGGGEWCVGPQCNENCKDAENPQCGIITCPANEHCDIVDCNEHPDHCTCDATSGVCQPAPIDCDTTPSKCTKPNCTPVEGGETCVCTDNSTQNCIPNPQIWMDGDTIYFDHTLQKPGEVFTFNAKYTNGGNIDAKITNVSKSFANVTAQKFMAYDVTYSDGTTHPEEGNVLNAGASVIYKVTVEYDSDTLPTTNELQAINGDTSSPNGRNGAYSSFEVNYGQN